VTTVNTTLLPVLQTAECAAAPRPKAAYAGIVASIGNGLTTGASWLSATRKSMTVPAFHDRLPLCSTT
jgi:hypothetical protein